MNYEFARHVLLRMPVKKPIDYITDQQFFLEDHFFRAAIRVATPAFYYILERKEFQSADLSVKESVTLQKYINRFCFRPTPFGLFSSVSLAEWESPVRGESTIPKLRPHIRASMTVQNLFAESIREKELLLKVNYKSNPSLYRVLNEYRFFRTGLDESGKHRDYQLQSIAFSKMLKDLISACFYGLFREKVVDLIAKLAKCSINEAEDYAAFLIDSQLLISCLRLNVSGGDYLTDMTRKLSGGALKMRLHNVAILLDDEISVVDPFYIKQLEQEICQLIPVGNIPQEKLSIILQRIDGVASIDMKLQEHLREGVAALMKLSTNWKSSAMEQFINGFQRHFEGQNLPLLLALDPETGIGYQHPEVEKNNILLETLNIPYRNETEQSGNWSAAHSVLMEIWLRDKSDDPVISIADSDLERLKSAILPEQMLGMSILFRVAENKVFIENAGGINAPALMGRFTVADEKIAAAAQAMATKLEAQNTEIIFAELLHLADPHTDNVNRRAHIYRYEIPVTAASTLAEEYQIHLSDLYIRIVNNMVMLYSAKHQKIVIPRLSSAYNHGLNKLPLFRFLADLPYQYGRSNLGLDLKQFFPLLRFYPRVEYKNTILALATWIITEQQLGDLQLPDQENAAKAFKILSRAIRLPRFFSLAEGDQELVFDSENGREVAFFCACIRQKKQAVIKEYMKQPIVQQYNAYLLPTSPLAISQIITSAKVKTKVQRKFAPGSEWLYLKIYAPRIGVNRLLLRLRPLLTKRYGEHRISQWFFIRYEDHAPHIRLRLQVAPESISLILMAFKEKMEDRIQQQVIREFQIDIYSRELERYAAGGISNTERFFWASSELVLHFLKRQKTNPLINTYAFALYSIQRMIAAFIIDVDEQAAFTLDSFKLFLPEFSDKPFRVDLDKKYRELTTGIIGVFKDNDARMHSGSLKAGNNFLKSLGEIQKNMSKQSVVEYLRSIIHMHLNRIFTDESRKQEMICYYLLHKYLLSMKGRNRGI
jgi:thiopeptide-type bacteriocin biosynthesis protein